MKTRVGHKINSFLNGQWCKHARKWGKWFGNRARRNLDRETIKKDLEDE